MISPPVGLSYNSEGALVLDPDKQVQQCLRLLFETFRSTGSAMATVKAFQKQGLQFPRRVRTGAHKGDLVWAALGHSQVLRILHNPRYAGAFVYGRSHVHFLPESLAERLCFTMLVAFTAAITSNPNF